MGAQDPWLFCAPGAIEDYELRWIDGTIGIYELLSAATYRAICTNELFSCSGQCQVPCWLARAAIAESY